MTLTADPVALTGTSRRGRVLVALMVIGTFGPYLYSGVRTEQLAVYATLLVPALGLWWMKVSLNGHGIAVMTLLTLQLAVAVIGAADPPQNTTGYQFNSVLAGIDNLALPLAVIAMVWALRSAGGDRGVLIKLVCRLTVWLMVANAGLAVWATTGSGPDLTIFQSFGLGETVAFRAEQHGRLSGIFNQPAEGGLMYSVAVLAAIYLYRERAVLLAVTGTVLTVGGVLTVSKVFLLVGVPIGVWQMMRSTGGRWRRLVALLAASVVVWGAVRSGLTPKWAGEDFLLRLLPGGGQDTVDLYSAGRFGSESTLARVAGPILASSPLWGFGAGGLLVAYDNAWVEALAMTGLAGAAALTLVMAVLVHASWSIRRTAVPEPESRLAAGLVAVVIGAALGVPSLTVNRCATIIWLLLALLLLTRRTEDSCPVRAEP